MLRNFIKRTQVILLAILLSTGCGLLPNFKSNPSSNAESAVLYMEMGARYLDMGMLDIAKEKLDVAVKLDSSNPDIHNTIGVFYEHIKDYPQAKDSYDTALRKGPDNYAIQSNVGRFYCQRGDFNRGVQLLQQALDAPMNSHQWFAYSNMGLCYETQKDLQKAEEYFRKALQLQPEFPPALQEMQKISYENRQYMSARAFLERFLSVSQHTPESLWIAFQTERALGNSSGAQEYGELYINSYPATDEADQIRTVLGR
ncbi:MAG: type IV pilus biogenesis/stability protein PilW [Methylomonas sp.]|jgi:type IV pilus assembly protein PilF